MISLQIEIDKILKEEEMNSKTFPKWPKKIRKEYFELLNSFFNKKPMHDKEMKNIFLCFKGIFRNFLKDIKKKYKSEKFWRIKSDKFQQKKKVL